MKHILFLFGSFLILFSCRLADKPIPKTQSTSTPSEVSDTSFFGRLSDSTMTLTNFKVSYDPSYFQISYPNGDVPADKGVCSDVVIRAYRKMGIDLQKEVHEDLKNNFSVYPHKWGLKSADANIDHRRVPYLMRYFERQHASLPITGAAQDYKAGDIVCWNLGKDITHANQEMSVL